MDWGLLALPGFFIWAIILLLPWRPWSTRENLDTDPDLPATCDLTRVTVLIPARNEATVIQETLDGLAAQAGQPEIIIIDDQSEDRTAVIAGENKRPGLRLIMGQPLPADWTGKLWALEQGRQQANTELILLLDADIKLAPGILKTLLNKLDRENLAMISLMAHLRMESNWEKMLMPAFIFFFKLLYPFHLSNKQSRLVAAAAGGCILVRKAMLDETGAFTSLRDCLIDDCALARKIREHGGLSWTGLTHSATSLRPYDRPGVIWDMVARTAFTQLRHSWLLLLLCTILMAVAFLLPLAGLFSFSGWPVMVGAVTLLIMYLCYLPVVSYYSVHPLWGLTLPATGLMFLLMTWSSAYRHVNSTGAHWKGRFYSASAHK